MDDSNSGGTGGLDPLNSICVWCGDTVTCDGIRFNAWGDTMCRTCLEIDLLLSEQPSDCLKCSVCRKDFERNEVVTDPSGDNTCKSCINFNPCDQSLPCLKCKKVGNLYVNDRHGRVFCIDCMRPWVMCDHLRKKTRCKECGGGSLCTHGKERSRCKDCGGGSLCSHGRQKYRCKECGGASICSHGREKKICKDCGGSSLCSHGRQKHKCKECGGSSVCGHGRVRIQCKDCMSPEKYAMRCQKMKDYNALKKASKKKADQASLDTPLRRNSFCSHGRKKSQCKDCGGSFICGHGRARNRCKDCGGAGICGHGRRRNQCRECMTPEEYAMYCQKKSDYNARYKGKKKAAAQASSDAPPSKKRRCQGIASSPPAEPPNSCSRCKKAMPGIGSAALVMCAECRGV